MQTNEQRIITIIAEQFGVDESSIKPETHLRDDLGSDSLDDVEIVMMIEDEFNIEISDADAEAAVTVQQIFDYIAANVK